ncbi:MAG: ATP-binding protein [Patescibacteria group bacterium]
MKKETKSKKTPFSIEAKFPADLSVLAFLRNGVYNLLKQKPEIGEKLARRAQVITDELCTNAIQHGSEKNGEIQFTLEYIKDKKSSEEGEIKITVKDQGKEKRKTRRNQKIHGRGLKIVQSWSDKFKTTKTKTNGTKVQSTIKTPNS